MLKQKKQAHYFWVLAGILILLLIAVALFINYSPTLTGRAIADASTYTELQKTTVGEDLLATESLYYAEYFRSSTSSELVKDYTVKDMSKTAEIVLRKSGIVGYFFPQNLKLPPGTYTTIPTPAKGVSPISRSDASDSTGLFKGDGQAEAILRAHGVYAVPIPNYLTYYLGSGRLIGYAAEQPTKIPPPATTLPLPISRPTSDYGSLEVFIGAYDTTKGRYDLWIVYNDGNIVIKDINFSIRYHKNMADATTYNYADTKYGLTVSNPESMKQEESLLFPGEEVRTSFTTKGTFGSSAYAIRVCPPGSVLPCNSDPAGRPARLINLMAAKNSEVQTSMNNDPGDDNYDILAVKHGYALSDVTGVDPKGNRVTIPVKKTSMRDA